MSILRANGRRKILIPKILLAKYSFHCLCAPGCPKTHMRAGEGLFLGSISIVESWGNYHAAIFPHACC
jgi:hypothetical protein